MSSRYANKRFGKLTMLHAHRRGGDGIGAIWKAICDCGNVVEVLARKARRGDVTTCGNCTKGLGIQGSGKVVKQGIDEGHRTHFSALLRKKPTAQITAHQYNDLLGNPCVACGGHPVHVEWVNPNEDPTDMQMIPICNPCSTMRRGAKLQTWLGLVMKISTHIRQITNENY